MMGQKQLFFISAALAALIVVGIALLGNIVFRGSSNTPTPSPTAVVQEEPAARPTPPPPPQATAPTAAPSASPAGPSATPAGVGGFGLPPGYQPPGGTTSGGEEVPDLKKITPIASPTSSPAPAGATAQPGEKGNGGLFGKLGGLLGRGKKALAGPTPTPTPSPSRGVVQKITFGHPWLGLLVLFLIVIAFAIGTGFIGIERDY